MSNILYRKIIEKSSKFFFRREPGKRAHREVVVSAFADGKLSFEVLKAEETVGSVKFLVVFAVTALHLAVVARGEDV